MFVSRLLRRNTKTIISILANTKYLFSQQKRIQYTPQQLQHIHSMAKHKQLPFIKSIADYYTVCIVGLPNSGKSTLYNCIIGEHMALTDSIPGMTRDRKQTFIWDGLLKLVDTAGVETHKIHQDIMRQTIQAYKEADKILLVVDGKSGINEHELQFSKIIRQYGLTDKVVLVVNKMQSTDELQVANQVYDMGFKEIMYTSGEQGNGVLQLMQYINQCIPQKLKDKVKLLRQMRKQRFKKVIKQIKQSIKKQLKPQDKFDLKKWQRQFRKLNPDPQQNSQLDEQPNIESFTRPQQSFGKERGVSSFNPMQKKPVQISIIGRPNVGKSSLINKLLNQNRMMVSEIAHTTTDSIINQLQYNGRKIKLVDTAGLNSSNFDSNEEHLKKAQIVAMNHVKYSHVVIYMIDSDSALRSLDFTFIQRVVEQGRPVILAINKWETIKNQYRKKALAYLDKQIQTNLGELNGMPVVPISAIMEQGLQKLMDEVLKMYDQWNLRVSTGMLNNWVQKFNKLDNLPKQGCQNLKIRFIVQAKVRPPTFIVFVNNKSIFKDNYHRFMKDKMVSQFKLEGIPIRYIIKNAAKEVNVKDSDKYKQFKKRKQSIKQSQRREKLKDLKEKYGNFGRKTS